MKFLGMSNRLRSRLPQTLTAVKRNKYAKNKKTASKGRLSYFSVQMLALYQYPVDLLTFLQLYLKSSTYLKMGKFRLDRAICQGNFFPDAEHLKVKELVYLKETVIY